MDTATRSDPDAVLGNHVRTHGEVAGVTAAIKKPVKPTTYGMVMGGAFGFFIGLMATLFTDIVILLPIGILVGAAVGYALTRGISTESMVYEAALYEQGVVFVDSRGTHRVRYGEIDRLQARQTQNVAATPIGDIRGRTEYHCLVWTKSGTGYFLDDRLSDVRQLIDDIARRSGAPVVPLG